MVDKSLPKCGFWNWWVNKCVPVVGTLSAEWLRAYIFKFIANIISNEHFNKFQDMYNYVVSKVSVNYNRFD